MKSYKYSLKNKRVILCYSNEEECFYLQFKKLKEKDESIIESKKDTTATVIIHKGILVVTTIKLSKEIGYFLFQNFRHFMVDARNGEYPSWLNCR